MTYRRQFGSLLLDVILSRCRQSITVFVVFILVAVLLRREIVIAIFSILPDLIERTLPGIGHGRRHAGVS